MLHSMSPKTAFVFLNKLVSYIGRVSRILRQHGQPLLRSAPYHEIAPHLVLMAFLHRVVNGEGPIDREYAIGSRRIDLCVTHGTVRMAMELKVWRDGAHWAPL